MNPKFDHLWNYSKPQETETQFRELLEVAKQSWNLNDLTELQSQIVRTLGLQKKFEEGHRLLDEIGANPSTNNYVAEIRCLLERGRLFNCDSHPAHHPFGATRSPAIHGLRVREEERDGGSHF
jgi:hypothetical protein